MYVIDRSEMASKTAELQKCLKVTSEGGNSFRLLTIKEENGRMNLTFVDEKVVDQLVPLVKKEIKQEPEDIEEELDTEEDQEDALCDESENVAASADDMVSSCSSMYDSISIKDEVFIDTSEELCPQDSDTRSNMLVQHLLTPPREEFTLDEETHSEMLKKAKKNSHSLLVSLLNAGVLQPGTPPESPPDRHPANPPEKPPDFLLANLLKSRPEKSSPNLVANPPDLRLTTLLDSLPEKRLPNPVEKPPDLCLASLLGSRPEMRLASLLGDRPEKSLADPPVSYLEKNAANPQESNAEQRLANLLECSPEKNVAKPLESPSDRRLANPPEKPYRGDPHVIVNHSKHSQKDEQQPLDLTLGTGVARKRPCEVGETEDSDCAPTPNKLNVYIDDTGLHSLISSSRALLSLFNEQRNIQPQLQEQQQQQQQQQHEPQQQIPVFDVPDDMDPTDVELAFTDEVLLSLSMRDLNRKLRQFPRDMVLRLKQRRRMLKNRGYAQTCRSRRQQQRSELEATIRDLQSELRGVRMELARVVRELNQYKQGHIFSLNIFPSQVMVQPAVSHCVDAASDVAKDHPGGLRPLPSVDENRVSPSQETTASTGLPSSVLTGPSGRKSAVGGGHEELPDGGEVHSTSPFATRCHSDTSASSKGFSSSVCTPEMSEESGVDQNLDSVSGDVSSRDGSSPPGKVKSPDFIGRFYDFCLRRTGSRLFVGSEQSDSDSQDAVQVQSQGKSSSGAPDPEVSENPVNIVNLSVSEVEGSGELPDDNETCQRVSLNSGNNSLLIVSPSLHEEITTSDSSDSNLETTGIVNSDPLSGI
ncbi:uncharacterized protein LOC134530262 [Bacillus rossius redtenbacheri]|uniref:uncharacterized protein LOC134530262 n=1 Tax=Bacillus rossius redtenbacheri TaxID=93214 RepID=UPI002FDD7965